MHFYTSVNVNYLAKARVLAASVKRHCQDAYFSLLLYDTPPEHFDLSKEPFDELVTLDDLRLPVPNLKMWIYLHNVVELGTAIKGQALLNFLKRSPKVVYLDPDIVVYHDLEELDKLLNTYAVVLTPHQLAPDRDKSAIVGNEIGSMLRGTYNFGFYAANNSDNGMRFAEWFRDRLLDYCYDDVANGLFTDQRWGNLVPAMFEDVYIWRNPGCNVSTWNLTHRVITKNENGDYLVNGLPLLFYHFSGFDSGAQLDMVNFFGNGNPLLYEMRDWYTAQQNAAGQRELVKRPFKYQFYSDGVRIPQEHRLFMREHMDLVAAFGDTDPFDVTIPASVRSYYYKIHPTGAVKAERAVLHVLNAPFRLGKRVLRGTLRLMKRVVKKAVKTVFPNARRDYSA